MNITYGYCRVSTEHQSLTRQIKNILDTFPDAIIIKEYYTGTTSSRPEWSNLISKIQKGDTIVFDSVSRMSRNATEGFHDYESLYKLGVNLVFLKEPHIDSSVFKTSVNKMIYISVSTGNKAVDNYFKGNIELINTLIFELAEQQIEIAFAQSQKEVDDLHDRIQEGMRLAKSQGKQIGNQKGIKITTKKSVECKEIIKKYSQDFDGTLPDIQVIKLCECARNSYYKYKKELMLSPTGETFNTVDELFDNILDKKK